MPDILIDPVLFIVPNSRESQKDKVDYLAHLVRWWQTALLSTDCSWHFPQLAALLLSSYQLFPGLTVLRQLQNISRDHGGSQADISIKQLHQWTLACTKRSFDEKIDPASEPLKQLLKATDYIDDVRRVKVPFQPAEFAQRWPDFLREEMHRLFEKTCLYANLKYDFAEHIMIATRPFINKASTGAGNVVKVSTKVARIVVKGDGTQEIEEKIISHPFSLLTSPTDLPFSIQSWQWDGDEQSLRAAIDREYNERYRIEVEEIQKARREKQQGKNARKLGNQVELHYPFSYTFSSEFLERLREAAEGATQENLPRRVVEAAAAIIADREHDKKSLHAKQLRESEGGGVPGRRRGEDKAWRIYITVSRGGWRLNYWKGPDPYALGRKRVEFAMMQLENEIPKV